MSRTDAEKALRIYKTFVERTNDVIEYLSEAKSLEHALRLQIPNVKHAPTGLTQALEDYLNDADFEMNRRQYLEGKEKGLSTSAPGTSAAASKTAATETKPAQPGTLFNE
jgi:phosphatidylinositol-binding clathrin assembly protein